MPLPLIRRWVFLSGLWILGCSGIQTPPAAVSPVVPQASPSAGVSYPYPSWEATPAPTDAPVIDGSTRLQFTPQRVCAGMTLQISGRIPIAAGSAEVRLFPQAGSVTSDTGKGRPDEAGTGILLGPLTLAADGTFAHSLILPNSLASGRYNLIVQAAQARAANTNTLDIQSVCS